MTPRWIALPLLLIGGPLPASAAEVSFNRDVRPILADACFHCHGQDQAQRKGNLRLDIEADAKRKAIVPGKLAASELWRRVNASGEDRMPPAHSDRKITAQQIATLGKWIESGAKWESHWAFTRPKPPVIPLIRGIQPIDALIHQRLEREGLKLSPEATKATLLRRVTLDLTGLPPTVEELDAFLKDTSTDAYSIVVDRLLASPRFGERMAWRWLDAARYADTNGYQTDAERDMYRYRDWVIDAYNRNMPYDQFTIEQLAGDLLPNATLDQKIATAFNRNHRGNSEGGIVPEEYLVEYAVDRVETTATVWLGLTVGCARCHDHKYDPITQQEFYQLYAFYNSIPEKGKAAKYGNSPPLIKAPTPEDLAERSKLEKQLKSVQAYFDAVMAKSGKEQAEWMKTVQPATLPDGSTDRQLVYHQRFETASDLVIDNGKASIVAGVFKKALHLDGKHFVNAGDVGVFGFDDKFSFSFWLNPNSSNGVVLSKMMEEEKGEGYCVELVNGKLQVHLTKRWLDDALRIETAEPIALKKWQHVTLTYDGSRKGVNVGVWIDGERVKTRILFDELNQTFKTSEPLRIGAGGGPTVPRLNGMIDDLRIYDRVLDATEIQVLSVPSTLSEILQLEVGKRNDKAKLKVSEHYRLNEAPENLKSLALAVRQLRERLQEMEEKWPTLMIMEEMPKPRDAFILLRGEYDKPGKKVSRNVPAALSAFPKDAPNNRLGLAKWLVDPENPLTARVAVNRMWQLHFGMGLVKTVDDFGIQGDFPVHPELLDYLAVQFIINGWDVKKMHKMIVMSAAYRQSSRVTKESWARDPENRLLARGPRYRLSPEMLRDQALFTSGLLVEKLGGPSVKPYQPPGLWKDLSGGLDYVADKGEGLHRRSLYTFWKRTATFPTLAAFDASAREYCTVRETRTNTPLQALVLLNDVTFTESARVLAQKILRETKGDWDDRIEAGFRRVVVRSPSTVELKILRDGFDSYLKEYRANPAAAKRLLAIGEALVDVKLDPVEIAALAATCNLLLNLDEVLCKE